MERIKLTKKDGVRAVFIFGIYLPIVRYFLRLLKLNKTIESNDPDPIKDEIYAELKESAIHIQYGTKLNEHQLQQKNAIQQEFDQSTARRIVMGRYIDRNGKLHFKKIREFGIAILMVVILISTSIMTVGISIDIALLQNTPAIRKIVTILMVNLIPLVPLLILSYITIFPIFAYWKIKKIPP